MQKTIYQDILRKKQQGRRQFAVLIDPDKFHPTQMKQLVIHAQEVGVDYFFIGGSLIISNRLDELILTIKEYVDIPVVLFPGSPLQISPKANALLFLSLISGRNPELLIGQHVIAAPIIKESGLEVIATGYMIVDGGRPTTVSYISNTQPLPADKPEIAACTALAGEMLGLQAIYMDSGSGARNPILPEMILSVREQIRLPLIIGGGIRTPQQATAAAQAGADIIVVGNAIEKEPSLLEEMTMAVHAVNLPADKMK